MGVACHGLSGCENYDEMHQDITELEKMIEMCRDALEPIANDSQEANFVFGHLSHYLLTGEVSVDGEVKKS